MLAIIVCELSFGGKIEDVTTTIIGDDLLRHFWTLVHTPEIRMANIDNFLTQRVMISTSLQPPGVFKSPSIDHKLLQSIKETESLVLNNL